jgi:hypothetical protein
MSRFGQSNCKNWRAFRQQVFFFLRPRDMGLAGNPHRHPLHAAFCKHD